MDLLRYVSRVDYLRERCRQKRVLHLGRSSGRYLQDRLARDSLLHAILDQEAHELYGVDVDEESLSLMRDQLGFRNLYCCDAERLDELNLSESFDLVVAGDLLEHVTRPGALLEGVRRFLRPEGELFVSTVNAFGLHFQLRRWIGTYGEHPEHVCFYSPETLVHLLERHRYGVQEICGAYTEPPHGPLGRIQFRLASPLLKREPVLAGTLLAVATACQP